MGKAMPDINKPILSIILPFVILCIASSCGDSKRKAYEEAVIEWTGKEILFPDSMRLVGGGMIAKPEADFTIVSYYDSVGCTGCRMKLRFWNEFMQRVDSVRGDKTVNLIMIAVSNDEKELDYIRKNDNFGYYMVLDPKDTINSMNKFPEDAEIQTFLLDKDFRVLTFGNPLMNRSTARLYISLIECPDSLENVQVDYTDDQNILEHDLGEVPVGKTAIYGFSLVNQSRDTLKVSDITTSCDCTEGKVIPMEIPPRSSYIVEVSVNDTVPGDFLRSVTVAFENNKSRLLRFEVTGKLINKLK